MTGVMISTPLTSWRLNRAARKLVSTNSRANDLNNTALCERTLGRDVTDRNIRDMFIVDYTYFPFVCHNIITLGAIARRCRKEVFDWMTRDKNNSCFESCIAL